MGVTITDVSTMLTEAGLKVAPGIFPNQLRLMWTTENFVDPDTHTKVLMVLVQLEEDGEYIKIYAPHAFDAKGRHADDVLRAFMEIQWQTKLVQFEYNETGGQIQPIVEWPIEDGTVTAKQLRRAIQGLVAIVDTFSPVIERAAEKGKVDLTLAHAG